MNTTIKPFVCLNDIEAFYDFARENPSPVDFSVDTIRVGYPIADWSREEYKEFKTLDGKPAISTVALLLEINRAVTIELDKGENYSPHCAEDYCIEIIDIVDNVATVEFGS